MRFKTLGVWLGFNFSLSLKREGIGRVFVYLIRHLLKNYSLHVEIWCYECNRKEVTQMYADLLGDERYRERIKILSEESFSKSVMSRWKAFKRSFQLVLDILFHAAPINWKQPCLTYNSFYDAALKVKQKSSASAGQARQYALLPLDLFYSMILLMASFFAKGLRKTLFRGLRGIAVPKEHKELLSSLANSYSKADCFFVYIVSLENALHLKKPKMIFLPDLVTLEFYDYFVEQDPKAEHWIEAGKRASENFARQHAFFCGISEYGIKKQLMKYIEPVKESQVSFVYLASMIPQNIATNIPERAGLLDKYKISRKYLFYPTQIRAYKNVLTLLKALKLLKGEGIHLQLVLTGRLEQDKTAYAFSKANHLMEDIVSCGNLEEVELFGLYRHAAMTVSPSLFEGGFPLQALESLSVSTPVVLARIPVTIERLRSAGFDPETCGLQLFDPNNETELFHIIMRVLDDRNAAVSDQRAVKDALLSYTWDDVSHRYHALFQALIDGRQIRKQQ